MSIDFKLPGSTYDELTKIVKAYFSAKKTTLDELSKLSGASKTQISRNNGFLMSVGIIQEKDRLISEKGKELAIALDHNVEDGIQFAWKKIILENDFLSKMVSALRIRNGMDIDAFKTHIAYSSGQKNSQHVTTGAITIINILKVSNSIIEKDSKLYAGNEHKLESNTDNNFDNKIEVNNDEKYREEVLSVRKSNDISININIQVSKDDFPEIIENLKQLIDEIG